MFIAFDRITVALALLGLYTYPAMVAAANVALGREALDRPRAARAWPRDRRDGGGRRIAARSRGRASARCHRLWVRPWCGGQSGSLRRGQSIGVPVGARRAGDGRRPCGHRSCVLCRCRRGGRTARAGLPAQRRRSILPLLAFTGLFAAAIPSILFLTGIRAIGGTRAGILMLFEPVVGVVLAAWLLDEGLTPLQLAVAAGGPRRGRDPPALGGATAERRSSRRPRSRRPRAERTRVGRSPAGARGSPRLTPAIRVLLVDDHAMVRRGMRDFLGLARRSRGRRRGRRRRRGARAGRRLAPRCRRHGSADARAWTASRRRPRSRQRHPEIEVVAITSFIEEDRIAAAIEAGASGFLLKDAEADDLAAAIRAAHAGEVHLDPAVAGIVARRMRHGRPGSAAAASAPRAGAGRRPSLDAPRTRRARRRRPRALEPGDRRRARHRRTHRPDARLEHPRQARARRAGRRPRCSRSSTAWTVADDATRGRVDPARTSTAQTSPRARRTPGDRVRPRHPALPDVWAPQMAALAGEFRAIAIDLPGHGALGRRTVHAARRRRRASPRRSTEAARWQRGRGRAVARRLRRDGSRRPRARTSSAASSWPARRPSRRGSRPLPYLALAWVDGIGRRGRGSTAVNALVLPDAAIAPAIAEPIIAGGFWSRGGAEALRALAGERFIPRLAAYPGPTLIINGELRPAVPALRGRPSRSAARDARRVRIAGAAHLANLDRPAAFNAAVRSFAGPGARA